MRRFFLAVAACSLAACPAALAGPPAKKAAEAKRSFVGADKPPFTCPVMGARIGSPEVAAGKSVYKGRTYYFCCGPCKPAFDKEPAKFVKAAKPAPAPTKRSFGSAKKKA